jgi:2Fe-2S ferredoxin
MDPVGQQRKPHVMSFPTPKLPLVLEGEPVPNIHLELRVGEPREIDARLGESVMEAALRAGVPGIIGECGGNLSCATCHVHVQPKWMEVVGEKTGDEADLLEFDEMLAANSRLGCQITITDELDGLQLRVP